MKSKTSEHHAPNQLADYFRTAYTRYIQTHYPKHDTLGEVIHYALSTPGKHTRPHLCLAVAQALGQNIDRALCPAIAIEMAHTYSLVHDDLPCMDNDDLRRGLPTTHKKFNEAKAILAGDALIADAFMLLSEARTFGMSDAQSVLLTRELAQAIGSKGIVWGQTLDIANTTTSLSELLEIHTTKTAELIGASCAMGAITATPDEQIIQSYRKVGRLVGLSFQIIDDLLDAKEGTGKSTGKDALAGKKTYLQLLGYDESMRTAQKLSDEAVHILSNQDYDTQSLQKFILELIHRQK